MVKFILKNCQPISGQDTLRLGCFMLYASEFGAGWSE